MTGRTRQHEELSSQSLPDALLDELEFLPSLILHVAVVNNIRCQGLESRELLDADMQLSCFGVEVGDVLHTDDEMFDTIDERCGQKIDDLRELRCGLRDML